MSLIADALRRAQQTAARALPSSSRWPVAVSSAAGSPPAGGRTSRRRVLALCGAVGGAGVLAVGALYLTWPRVPTVATRAPARPVPIVEPAPALELLPSAPVRVPSQPTPMSRSEAGTSIPEVRAALEARKDTAREVAELTAGDASKARAARKTQPAKAPQRPASQEQVARAREVAELRAEEAVPQTAKPPSKPRPLLAAPPAPREPLPPRPAAPKSAPAKPAAPARSAPPSLVVHPDGGKVAAGFFASALRFHSEGRLPEAIAEYENALAADPRNPPVLSNLGVALMDSGRLDQAREALEKALALDPTYEKTLNNLGVLHYRKGQYVEAVSLFRQALQINPTNVESHVNLGIIYLLTERPDEAQDALEKALSHDPKRAEVHYNLGLLWERRGNRARAERHFELFVGFARDRHGPLVAKVRERLDAFHAGR